MSATPLAVGDPIKGRCTKCRKNTSHTIVTLSEGDPGRVQCGVCSREHKYRPPTVAKKPLSRQTVNRKEAERQEWQALRPSLDSAKATAYSMTGAFKLKSVIRHPVFGLGLVQRVSGPHKVEVLFEDGKKTMRCG